MTEGRIPSGHKLIVGVARVYSSDFVGLSLGILVAVVLTRGLGPDRYGIYVLAANVVFLVNLVCAAMFSRSSVHLVASTPDKNALGSMMIRLHLFTGLAGAAFLFLCAPAIASLLNQASLEGILRLFALDIPFFSLTIAHRNLLVGMGRHNPRALGPVGNWLIRLLMVLLLLELGFSINGAVLPAIAGSAAELCIYRYFVRPPLWLRSPLRLKAFIAYATPVFFHSISSQVFIRLDLIMLGALLASPQWAGLYGAAMAFCIPVRLFSYALSHLLISDLSSLIKEGRSMVANARIKEAWRVLWSLLPAAGIGSASARELVVLFLGPQFEGAGVPLTWLLYATWFYLLIMVGCAMLISLEKARFILYATLWMPLAAFICHGLLIPKYAELGAAMVTTAISMIGAGAIIHQVWRAWRVLPPLVTMIRSIVICAGLFSLGLVWSAPGLWILLKMAVLLSLGLAALVICREFRLSEIWWALRLVLGREPQKQGS